MPHGRDGNYSCIGNEKVFLKNDRDRDVIATVDLPDRDQYRAGPTPAQTDRLPRRGSCLTPENGRATESRHSDSVRFPDGGIAWDLNYRGDRPFLRQAAAQVSTRGLRVADGWDYFTISWALHVARVFGTPEDPETLGRAVQATIRP